MAFLNDKMTSVMFPNALAFRIGVFTNDCKLSVSVNLALLVLVE